MREDVSSIAAMIGEPDERHAQNTAAQPR